MAQAVLVQGSQSVTQATRQTVLARQTLALLRLHTMAYFHLRSFLLAVCLMTLPSMAQAAVAKQAAVATKRSDATKPPSLRGAVTADSGSGSGAEQRELSAVSADASGSSSSIGAEDDFCAQRNPGWFCSGFTRVRCCDYSWGLAQCESEEHCHGCGWKN